MKSFLLAATAATAVSATSLLELGLNVDLTKTIDLGADLKIHLPQGIDLPAAAAEKPTGNPPPGHVNVWHPAHHGVVIDQCDDEDNDGWHFVHPCGDSCKPEQPSQVWTTSTVSVTSMHTVISCAPTVTNCPANGKHTTTVVIPETTTICPVEAAKTKTADQTPAPSSAGSPSPASSPANASPVPTNTGVVTLSTQTLPATGPAGAPSSAPSGVASGVPSGAPSGYPVPGSSAPALTAPPAVPSGPASAPAGSSVPAYPVPGNSSAPAYPTSAYSPPAQSSPAGCVGDECSPSAPSAPAYSAPAAPPAPASPAGGCSGAYCPPPPAGTAPSAAPLPTGNSTVPLPNGAVSRTQGAGMALFAGAVAALFL
ncbi:hypothetical protein BBK36DRAFT_216 [Trichoderma citrinoviride]|uniref:Lytic polysaccharide monooxygenase n=1 Tax=Trichoderma citrinoviride TaxID=58853 RepID=A0A2T4BM00_9HYPO|nr:hypothetical protein BBK36DRAFT_216 [Trichoderma citrinoviride]PTB70338.1 hypothetical protein BBK36DRAFT_216 [Trichoderma citrinoviride]